jgi:hypothetical protein
MPKRATGGKASGIGTILQYGPISVIPVTAIIHHLLL